MPLRWGLMTITTVGYDLNPKTLLGKLIGGFCALSGVFILTLPIPIVVNSFAQFYKNRLWRNEVEHKKRERTVQLAAEKRAAKGSLDQVWDSFWSQEIWNHIGLIQGAGGETTMLTGMNQVVDKLTVGEERSTTRWLNGAPTEGLSPYFSHETTYDTMKDDFIL